MKTGITFWVGNKDYFVITDQKNRTIPFAIRVLKALKLAPTNANAKELVRRMQKATLERKETGSGKLFYTIHGDGFCSVNPIEDDCTVILALN